ncbi:MAG TPA: hypothetical protein VN033_02610 [Vulgatibacter sp.]|nr:hypothetical protein [Vulgatibacter sp.]
MSRRCAMALLLATVLSACEDCHERRRICEAPPSGAEAVCEAAGRDRIDRPRPERVGGRVARR